MPTVSETKDGIRYLIEVLKQKARTITRVCLWKIPHKTAEQEDVCLKIGRYHSNGIARETPEVPNPKSELTLDKDELQKLLEFLSKNYEPFKKGVRQYMPIDEKFDQKSVEHIRAIFENPDKQKLLDFVATNNILPDDFIASLENQTRIKAVQEFRVMLDQDLVEQKWQDWLKKNGWVLGSDFVRILDEREIDTSNIADYLIEAYDGFLDIIEIKRPGGALKFWAETLDHGNYVPSSDLTKAITQATKYIYELECEANSIKFAERLGGVKTIKPRCVLIFGRSNDWSDEQKRAFRILNSSYHNLSIMTYDHVLARAQKILGFRDASV